ncbi:MAG: hypothetical protein E7418_00270 [Ruminococcaceae bacterium]|nr:hypothetical protein [Oscillospiraceae bacterium]
MLTIKKIENTSDAIAYLNAHGITHDITNEQVMAMTEGDKTLGLGSLSLVGYKVYMNFIHVEDGSDMLMHGLAKSLLNMADLRGMKTIYGSNPALDALYIRLRFKKEDNEYVLSLENYFQAEHH